MKIIELEAPVDDESLGLVKGESYYVLTHAQGVDGLTEFIKAIAPIYQIATSSIDGLMSKEDKAKLDQLDPVDIQKRLKWLEEHIKKE